jgi:hypothetical protein
MSISEEDLDLMYALIRYSFHQQSLTLEQFRSRFDSVFNENFKMLEAKAPGRYTQDEIEEIKRRVQIRYETNIGFVPGTPIILEQKGYKAWLQDAKSSINWQNWTRFKTYLSWLGRSSDYISKLDSLTDLVLDHMGNPKSKAGWHIKGLLMGDVQSGKTASYTAVCHKAVDAGYRMIVVLTGVTNTLRNQTQKRINADLMGMVVSNSSNRAAGVGTVADMKVTTDFRELTSADHDFEVSKLDQFFNLDNPNSVGVAVCKKNVSVLKNFQKWLCSMPERTKDLPFLLIDDEADTASVNTRKADDPTAVNKGIREILDYFKRSSYLAVTATPFANIFIDPQVDEDKKSELPDLFPIDFIYAIKPPAAYVGVERLFGEDSDLEDQALSHRCIIPLSETQDKAINRIHSGKLKKGDIISELPETLKTAVRYFVCCCVYRDKFEDPTLHASMLVHIDRHISLQDQLYRLIDDFLKAEYNGALLKENLPEKQLKKNARYEAYRTLWEDGCFAPDYPNSGKTFKELSGKSWHEIWCDDFSDSINAIQTVAVNSGKTVEKQEKDLTSLYERHGSHGEPGARVICVGGNSLSRGLTLYGLCVTYFSRISRSYDSLLQMGRWFGYYPNKDAEQYVRIWMSTSAITNFTLIASALGEFRQLIYRMKRDQKSPRDFGLRIRRAPTQTRLAVTYKKGSSVVISRVVEFAGYLYQTSKFQLKKELRQANVAKVAAFLKKISKYRFKKEKSSDFVWRGVPSSEIADFISDFGVYGWNRGIIADDLGRYISTKIGSEKWEVRLVSPEEGIARKKAKVGDLTVNKSVRKMVRTPFCYKILHGQLASASDFARGLTLEQIADIKRQKQECESYLENAAAEVADGSVNQPDDVKVINRDVLTFGPAEPKLLIYIMEIGKIEDQATGEVKTLGLDDAPASNDPDAITRSEDIYGLVVGIPGDPDIDRSSMQVKYQANRIAQLLEEEEFREDQEDDSQ